MADPDGDASLPATSEEISVVVTPNSYSTTQPDPESHVLPAEDEEEEDDQIQDYRFLTSLSKEKTKNGQPLLPRRGEKDFEPHGTLAQSSTLAASQAAMHEALSYERIHGPGGIDTAGSTDGSTTLYSIALTASHLIGFFDVETSLTFIPKEQGVWFRTMGRGIKGGSGGTLLEPEEALFLCERGTLDLRFGGRLNATHSTESGDESTDAELCSLEGLSMSVQAAYACCIGARGLTLEQYIVYAGLKRAGYTVFRAKQDEGQERNSTQASREVEPCISLQIWFQTLLKNLFSPPHTNPKPGQPLIGSSFFRDYTSIYTRLSIIPTHTPSTLASQSASPDYPPLKITYHAYRPSTPIRKSNLPPPEFYIAVLDARDTNFPSATQLTNLINSISIPTPADNPSRGPAKSGSALKSTNTTTTTATQNSIPAQSQSQPQSQAQSQAQSQTTKESRPPTLYMRLKNGRAGRHVLLAVVDSGLVSYIRVSEGVFADEKVWMGNVNGVSGKGGKKGFGARGGKGKGRGGRG